MSLAKGKINPLNVFSHRRLEQMPIHFQTVAFPLDKSYVEKIDHWIYYNLNSRYCIKTRTGYKDKRNTNMLEIGIEDSRELTMLILACPFLSSNTKEIL